MKPAYEVSDQVQHKTTYTATEEGWDIEFPGVGTSHVWKRR